MVAAFLRRPRQVWLRRALFQVHLWVGIIVCVYSLLIGVSGSVLVFEEELARIFRPGLMKASAPGRQQVCLPHVVDAVRRAYPDRKIEAVYAPGVRGENYVAYLGETRSVFVGARTGRILGHLDKGWLEWVEDLHFRLLAGRTGLIVNGIGAASLLVLCISGIVIWWPGVKTWKRALGANFQRRWQRINFDLHSSIGFWALAVLSVWAVSGIYFVWPEAFPAAGPPKMRDFGGTPRLPLDFFIRRAMEREPGARLEGVAFPDGKQPLSIMLARAEQGDFMRTTWIYFDPVRGDVVGKWRRGENRTLGDWFVWLLIPLHFGTYWGMAVKCVWASLGLSLPILAITGVLMYWNRVLKKRWRAIGNE